MDPLAEIAPDWTPYQYGFNNPLKFIDPTGMFENIYEEQEDGSYVLVQTNNDVVDEYRNRDGSVQYYDKGTGQMSKKVNNQTGEVNETPQNASRVFSISESYSLFSKTARGEAFEQTISNVATAAGLVVAGPGLASEQLVVQVASAGGVLNGADDLSGNFTENRNTLIQNQIGGQNGALLKMALNVMGAIVGGGQSAKAFKDKQTMEGVVNSVGTALDTYGVVDKNKKR